MTTSPTFETTSPKEATILLPKPSRPPKISDPNLFKRSQKKARPFSENKEAANIAPRPPSATFSKAGNLPSFNFFKFVTTLSKPCWIACCTDARVAPGILVNEAKRDETESKALPIAEPIRPGRKLILGIEIPLKLGNFIPRKFGNFNEGSDEPESCSSCSSSLKFTFS